MKYLKKFESYNNFNEVKGEIEDIKFILQDLKDDSWIVNIDYVPKRWENPKANFTIEVDNIKIYLKKKNCKPGSKYPLDAEFQTIEIKNEINRILSIYNDSKIEFKICTADRSYKDENHKHFVEIRNYLYGKWESMSKEEFIDFINADNKLLGIDIIIYLNTENLDQKNESYEPSEIEEIIDYLKDIYSEISEDFDVRVTPQNIHHKDLNYIEVSISKKSSIPYKIDDETGEEIEDWVNYKPSILKPSEIINTLLSSKSYIESIGGEISNVWMGNTNHGGNRINATISIDELLYNKPGAVEWKNISLRQISIKYSI